MNLPKFSPRIAGLLGLAAINSALLALVATQFGPAETMPPRKSENALNVSGSVKEIPVRKPFETYNSVLGRPVFFKTRGPFVPLQPVASPPAPVPMSPVVVAPGLAVGGIVLMKGVSKAFLFSKTGSVAGVWASEGDEFQGWRLQSIDDTGVKVEQGGRSLQLSLYPVN
jgi:hypothetical protein